MSDAVAQLAGDALAKLDRLLGAKDDETEFQDMSEVTRTVVKMRDALISRVRAEPGATAPRERLDRVNALLSVVASAEMTLLGIHWDRIRKSRDLLAELATAQNT
jgi:hypothetical protein